MPPDPKHKKKTLPTQISKSTSKPATPNSESSSITPNSESSSITPNSESSSVTLHKSISPVQNPKISDAEIQSFSSEELPQAPVIQETQETAKKSGI